ncbi:MAG: 3-dehydroquinate synthase [Acidimicrobiia bacterium]|nr:3-dehydroquinate synthase [Acidimicrobiia bacterium]
MSTLTVAVDPPYDVEIAPGALELVAAKLKDRKRVAVVSQATIADTYSARLLASIESETNARVGLFLMGDGETSKSMTTVEDLCRRFADWGLLRGDAIVALGGGVVGDTAGFAAAVYHRGVAIVQVPTTLLAMVDAAIGGKTAVNLAEGKNLVGAFHQPVAVVVDTSTLETLGQREFLSGLGEVAKYALLTDVVADPTGLTALLRLRSSAVLDRDPDVLTEVVACCVAIKAEVVAADPFEQTGRRATLNLGHTFAHALETVGGYDLTHGEAVAIGLVFAGALAGACGRVGSDVVDRYQALPHALGLPTQVPDGESGDPEQLLAVMRRDKKAAGGLSFVLPGQNGIERVDDPSDEALRYAFASVGIGI